MQPLKMDLYMSPISRYMLLVLILVLVFGAAFLYSKYLLNKSVETAVHKFIIPNLEAKGLDFCDFILLPNQYFGLFKEKGDWENIATPTLFDDTRYNRKLYGKLRYRNRENKEELFTTVKISLNGQSQPVKVDFCPCI